MYKNILIPISFEEDRAAASAIAVARSLVAEGGRFTLLHAVEQIPAYVASYLPSHLLSERHRSVEDEIGQMAREIPNASGVVVSGHAGRAILDWAAEHDVDCIVMASHRPGMQDLLLGSTAAKVVRHAACAVHVLR